MQVYTKTEAIDAMMTGKKMTHPLFSENEWITIRNGNIYSEDSVCHPQFWEIRKDPQFETGWTEWTEKEDPTPHVKAAEATSGEKKKKNTDIFATMIERGMDLRVSPNFVAANKCAGGGLVTMGVDHKTLIDLANTDLVGKPKYMLMLYVINVEQYNAVRDEA